MDKKQDIRAAKKYTKEYFKQVGKINYPRNEKKFIKKCSYKFILNLKKDNLLDKIKFISLHGT